MVITINETGRLILQGDCSLVLNSLSPGKVFILNKEGETLQGHNLVAGDNIIDISGLKQGSYALRIENRNNHCVSSFEIK
jgi:ABC-type uncharacterized transport system ATPase subunit